MSDANKLEPELEAHMVINLHEAHSTFMEMLAPQAWM